VHVTGGGSDVWYASAVGALAAGVAGFVVAQRRRKKRHEEIIDHVFAEQYSNDGNTRFSDELDTIATETPAFEHLCDQLFHGEDLDGWLDQR
jgi:LPXTG-motif cell wall-anchored protein